MPPAPDPFSPIFSPHLLAGNLSPVLAIPRPLSYQLQFVSSASPGYRGPARRVPSRRPCTERMPEKLLGLLYITRLLTREVGGQHAPPLGEGRRRASAQDGDVVGAHYGAPHRG